MIRKKRKIRRNPKDSIYINLLTSGLLFAEHLHISDILIYNKQGYKCDDCNEEFDFCKCEYCENCRVNRCICKYDIWDDPNQNWISKNKIRNVIWKLAKDTLNDEELLYLFNNIIKQYKEYQKIITTSYRGGLNVNISWVDEILKFQDIKSEKFLIEKLRKFKGINET